MCREGSDRVSNPWYYSKIKRNVTVNFDSGKIIEVPVIAEGLCNAREESKEKMNALYHKDRKKGYTLKEIEQN